ncbi:MAG: hypothetical protein MK198_03665 [Gracilimonas sp.]|uniref:AAA family ATPase n=1 Tax=Gracilimonas sp. TaxID=1974203 RepID=UPI00374FE235|nr:hypothetical protein [Gracilimonas sp.]
MNNLNNWFRDRYAWIQLAAIKLIEKNNLDDDDYKELVEICVKEANDELEDDGERRFNFIFNHSSNETIKLNSLDDINGINALSPRNPLKFDSDKLSIIYGRNGSGKSGYVRLLKHLTGSRLAGPLLSNVFNKSEDKQSCTVTYTIDKQIKTVKWIKENGHIKDLSNLDIYDSNSGNVYISEENEATYEPPLLGFFDKLIATSENLTDSINGKIESKISQKPRLPEDYIDTNLAKWYDQLSHNTALETIKSKVEWSEEDEKELSKLRERVNSESPKEKAEKLFKRRKRLNDLVKQTIKHVRELSDVNHSKITKLRETLENKKEAADAAANDLFSTIPLQGIESKVWEQLWEKAREYSEKGAYLNHKFPFTGEEAKCVLCQQPLSDNAKARLKSFETFVKGELKKEVNELEKKINKIIESYNEPANEERLTTIFDAIGVDDNEIRESTLSLYEFLRVRYQEFINEKEELTETSSVWNLLENARKLSHSYYTKASQLLIDAEEDNRQELKDALKELETKKWLSGQKEAIKNEITRLSEVKILEKAKKLTNSLAFSKKKGKLAEELITQTYIKRFNEELSNLGADNIRVILDKERVQKGRVLHRIKLDGLNDRSPDEILSEGEKRIVSIAAFIADVTGKEIPAPFIFDDPITSLDEEYEEAVVGRLIELAKDRQVIVFTHRLSLSSLLEESAKEDNINTNFIGIRKEHWGAGNPGETPINVKRPHRVLNTLLNNRLSPARKAYENEGREVYDPLAKSICSDFRILLERMIEDVLLADIVHRFRRSVQTDGKILKLSKITSEDCEYFDQMMTKYSAYEHSQPRSIPVELPEPDELEFELMKLKDWYDDFTNR